jgi:hypothetical protein
VKILISLVWLALAFGFAHLARGLGPESGPAPPALETGSPQFEIQGEGFHIQLDVEGTPLNEPFEALRAEVDEYVETVRQNARRNTQRVRWACWSGAAASLLGLALSWAPRERTSQA